MRRLLTWNSQMWVKKLSVIVLYFFSSSVLIYSSPLSALPCILGGSPPGSSQHHEQSLFPFFLFFLYGFRKGTGVLRCQVEWLRAIVACTPTPCWRPPTLTGRHRSCRVLSTQPSLPQILGTALFCCPFRPRSGFWVLIVTISELLQYYLLVSLNTTFIFIIGFYETLFKWHNLRMTSGFMAKATGGIEVSLTKMRKIRGWVWDVLNL